MEPLGPTPGLFSPGGILDQVTRPLINLAGAHPWMLVGLLVFLFAGRPMVLAYLKDAYPDKATRPRWVAGTLGALGALTNVWRWALRKVGITSAPEEPLSSDVIARAEQSAKAGG